VFEDDVVRNGFSAVIEKEDAPAEGVRSEAKENSQAGLAREVGGLVGSEARKGQVEGSVGSEMDARDGFDRSWRCVAECRKEVEFGRRVGRREARFRMSAVAISSDRVTVARAWRKASGKNSRGTGGCLKRCWKRVRRELTTTRSALRS